MSANPPTLLSAFTGLGGLDLGLEVAGFVSLGAIELSHVARASLKANRGGSWQLVDPPDIAAAATTLAPADFGVERGRLSLLAGGPPCQPFSKAAQWSRTSRIGLADPRASCISDFLDIVDRFLPLVVLIENVPGFVQGQTSVMPELTRRISVIKERHGVSYQISSRVIDAADHGVPQRRRRGIVIMVQDGLSFEWPEETHKESPTRAWDAIGDLSLTSEELTKPTGRWADLLPSIPEGRNYIWHTDRGGGRPLFGYRRRYWSFLLKLAKDQPAWTLPAQPGPATGPFHWDNRPLAIREMLRLQTFPADWNVEGDHREQVLQVGNATPPLLAEVFGRQIASALGYQAKTGALTYAVRHRRVIPAPAPPAPVPHRYRALEGDHAPHPGHGRGPQPRTVARDDKGES